VIVAIALAVVTPLFFPPVGSQQPPPPPNLVPTTARGYGLWQNLSDNGYETFLVRILSDNGEPLQQFADIPLGFRNLASRPRLTVVIR